MGMELWQAITVGAVTAAVVSVLVGVIYAIQLLTAFRREYRFLKHPPFWVDFWQTFFSRKPPYRHWSREELQPLQEWLDKK